MYSDKDKINRTFNHIELGNIHFQEIINPDVNYCLSNPCSYAAEICTSTVDKNHN